MTEKTLDRTEEVLDRLYWQRIAESLGQNVPEERDCWQCGGIGCEDC